MITICFVYFKSLALANLKAALYSVRRQDLTDVSELLVLDNDTGQGEEVSRIVDSFAFPVPVRVLTVQHGDPTKTHSWSSNTAIRLSETPWILFTRADYLLHFDALACFRKYATGDVFVTRHGMHLNVDVAACERTAWRQLGTPALQRLPGVEFDYTEIDAGVWLTNRAAFDRVGGFDEGLTVWGHAQTHFQHKLYSSGTAFIRIPEVLFVHPMHAGHRDLMLAHQQLKDRGIDLQAMWARYQGASPYR